MMRALSVVVALMSFALWGCGGGSPEPDPSSAREPMAAAHGATESGPVGTHQSMEINTDITVDPTVLEGFRAVRLTVIDSTSGESLELEAPIGEATVLGDTGLTVTPQVFIPDFVMDDTGISSRSAEPNNPAVRVRIEEAGAEPFEGWLFAELPEVHPFVHDRYRVLLAGGIPASPGS